jgi:DNA mismatch repair protein MutL
MGKIVLLDDLTINQIAAGEVIERPANVVKELVENSVDAGATKITVEIKKGGKTYIKITDNGKGIEKEDMPLSLERHATSKIRTVEDLEHTYTMGFRGEALASIASISQFTMISKTEDEEVGIKIVAEAGDILSAEEVPVNTGTTIIVENIFFNTPVRYKFLKNDSTEFRYIKEWLQKFAMANLDISVKLINDGKIVFTSNGSGNIEDLIYVLYGKEVKENLIKVNYEEDKIKITGVIGTTLIARDTRKDQIIFLNKRNIKNNILTASSDQAFKGRWNWYWKIWIFHFEFGYASKLL